MKVEPWSDSYGREVATRHYERRFELVGEHVVLRMERAA